MLPRQTMSLGDTLLQLLFRFTVNTVSGAYLPLSYVGSDGLLRQHFPENVCSAFTIIIIIITVITFMHGIYNYIPETNRVSNAHSVAAVLYLQFLLHVMLFRLRNAYVLYLYIITVCSICAAHNTAVFVVH